MDFITAIIMSTLNLCALYSQSVVYVWEVDVEFCCQAVKLFVYEGNDVWLYDVLCWCMTLYVCGAQFSAKVDLSRLIMCICLMCVANNREEPEF